MADLLHKGVAVARECSRADGVEFVDLDPALFNGKPFHDLDGNRGRRNVQRAQDQWRHPG